MKTILNEGLDYHDLVNQVLPTVSVDEYAAKMGEDDEIVTLAFTVKGRQVGEDLADWLEKGYDYVLDAQVSDGELEPGKFIVFVEMDRRTTVPKRIVELVDDLNTLTDLKVSDWTIVIKDEEYDADENQLRQVIVLSPHQYRKEKESGLNEMRELSGMEPKKIFHKKDSSLKEYLSKAGL
jgi:hypothetical protein